MDNIRVFLSSFFFLVCSLSQFCHSIDTLTKGQSIRDGVASGNLISTGERFELGFFSPVNSTLRYVGVWYHQIEKQTVVWVANRNDPISDKNGSFSIGSDGNLMVFDGNGNAVWRSNGSNIESNTTAAKLSDNGNFILASSENIGFVDKAYWQSFEHPTDTYLPGMRVLVNLNKGDNHAFASWKSASDPSIGNYTLGVDPHGAPQIIIWEHQKRRWRSGQWNLQIFTGVNGTDNLANFRLSPRESDGSMYFTYNPANESDLLRFLISWDGHVEQLMWSELEKNWIIIQRQPENECELYNHCGDFGVCNKLESPKCRCMDGFVPKHVEQWNRGNWSDGCVRRTKLQCERNSSVAGQNGGGEDGFKRVKCMKLPDSADVLPQGQSGFCEERCLRNCSCTAYAEITGIGCMIWSGNLLDVQEFNKDPNTLLLHIRLANSELGGKRAISNAVIIVVVVVGSFVLAISAWLFWRFKGELEALCKDSPISCCKSSNVKMTDPSSREFSMDLSGPSEGFVIDGSQVNNADLPMYNFNAVAAATDNFSEENKLGQGGFGPVYKGKLPGGQEIAVKRLSRKSVQGDEEFKNEIIMIAKLQHRSLVRLLGCCIEGEEKMLLYEYMPNKSLDFFLFNPEKQGLLDWTKRFSIIEGIARGLLYLHRDSRLRIIHRDLKASNILLDEEMNPKISDFGMARIFGGNQNEANTVRVVGTYGYMSPEYAMEGLFSVKSDVYSFGVLLLEIVTGRRNTSFRTSDYSSLIGYAWQLWNEGKAMDLIDPKIWELCDREQAKRCIQVGMLCVQDSAMYRPTMASVVLMLESEAPTIPIPRQPTFTSRRSFVDNDFFSEVHDTVSSNDLTVTMVAGR